VPASQSNHRRANDRRGEKISAEEVERAIAKKLTAERKSWDEGSD